MPTPDPGALFPLPQVDDAPHVCVTLSIPGDEESISNFVGALSRLMLWNNYRRDPDKRGIKVANVWKKIVSDITFTSCELPQDGGIEVEEDMGIRVDCDCNVFITCCDGTEVQLATVPMLQKPNQAGAGTPPVSGACESWTAQHLLGNGQWYAPFVVNTGDTIQLTSVQGATYNPATGLWYCPDGSLFFAGVCGGNQVTAGGNPLPGTYSGKLIGKIGATYYDIYTGAAFTVPAGVVNQPLLLQFNYANIATSQGDVTFSIAFCNNAATTFTHTWDFTVNDGGWQKFAYTNPNAETWTPSVGWKSNHCTNILGGAGTYTLVAVTKALSAARTITDVQMIYTATLGANPGGDTTRLNLKVGAGDNFVINHAPTAGNGAGDVWHGSVAGVTLLEVHPIFAFSNAAGTCDNTPDVVLKKIIVSGIGTDPF